VKIEKSASGTGLNKELLALIFVLIEHNANKLGLAIF